MFAKLALRDVGILVGSLLLWRLLAERSGVPGPLGDVLGVLLGVLVAACFYLLHEWGHALGAMATRSVLAPARSLAGVSLFSFDSKRNGRGQFAVMSLSGFAVTALAVWFVYFVLPDGLLASRVARGGVLLLTALTVLIEVPLLVAGLVRRELPPVESFPI
ncbi:MAG: hypothetical protein HKP30_02685 [Myxococcales bacterium]|nr:hypothetical protein [Myxococcales bacterium]